MDLNLEIFVQFFRQVFRVFSKINGSFLFVVLQTLLDPSFISVERLFSEHELVRWFTDIPIFKDIINFGDCPPDKSWNKFEKVCIDLYNLFDKNAEISSTIKSNGDKFIGGSLSKELSCIDSTGIKTPFSIHDSSYSVKGMQYIEFRTASNSNAPGELDTVRGFVSKEDLEKVA